jgi:hypothetical protein
MRTSVASEELSAYNAVHLISLLNREYFPAMEINSLLIHTAMLQLNHSKLIPLRPEVRLSNKYIFITGNVAPSEPVNAVYCEDHTKHINTLSGQKAEFLFVKADDAYVYIVL